MSHYEEGLTPEEYEREVALVFGKQKRYTYCSLESLEGLVEIGIGKDAQEAKEVYLENIANLIEELKKG